LLPDFLGGGQKRLQRTIWDDYFFDFFFGRRLLLRTGGGFQSLGCGFRLIIDDRLFDCLFGSWLNLG
jgi:hypothetical protein